MVLGACRRIQFNPERQGGHLQAEAVVVACMRREGQGVEAWDPPSLFLALMVWLASMKRFLQSIFMPIISDVSTGHILILDF